MSPLLPPLNPGPARSRLPFPAWVPPLLLLMAVWGVWVGLGPRRTLAHGLLEIGVPLVLAWACVGVLGSAQRRPDLPAPFRAGLRWVLAGVALVAAANVNVLIEEVLVHGGLGGAILGVTDALCMASYPVVIFGLLRLPRSGPSPLGPWRILADGAVFTFGVGAPLWFLALLPSLAGAQGGAARFVDLAFPCLAFLGIGSVNFALLRSVPQPSQRAFRLLLGGIAAGWLSDLIFALHLTEQMQIPNLGHLANLVNGWSLLLMLLGAWFIRSDPRPVRSLKPAAFSPIPLFTLVVIAVWLARYLQVFEVTRGTLKEVLEGLILLLLFLLLREGLAAKDSIRQATEATALAARARFEALVEHSTDLILVVDPRGRTAFASPAAARFLGVGREMLEGRDLGDFIHPEEGAVWTGFLAGLLERPGQRAIQQWRMKGQDEAWRHFETSGSNLLGHPEVQGLVLNARDITERRHLEERVHQATKMEALGRLAGGVAHDFNNLLSAVLGNVELARMVHGGDPKLDARLARIQGAATRGAELTAHLLALTRRKARNPAVLRPERILAAVQPLVGGLLGDGIELATDLEPGAGCLRASLEDLEQVLLNLVLNARDAMPQGGTIRLAVRAAEVLDPVPTLFLAPAPGPYLLLEVADSGTGMEAEVLAHLFEPFFSTKGKDKGMGLIDVYGIVKASGGGIGIRSEPGRGTTVSLWFPRVPPEPEPAPRTLSAFPETGTGTLLLVEDEEDVREALEAILASLGYRVHVAGDADGARAFLASYGGPLDLLVTDVIMPGDSGPKLASEVVKDRPGLRVLYISGFTANELEAHGLAHPGALLLEKPFTREQIGRRIREVLA